MLKKKIIIFYIASTIFILDRLSKYFFLELSSSDDSFNIPITSFLNFNLVSELIKFGANPDRSGPNKETPLIIASRFGNFEAVKALLEGGAYPDDTDLTGRTALQWAKIKHYKRIKEVLIEYGAYDN